MKRLLLFCLLTTCSICFAQKHAIITAYNHLKDDRLDLAKETIDPTISHKDTKDDAKAWKYLGDIYYQIYFSDNEVYKNLDSDPLLKSYNAYRKSLTLNSVRLDSKSVNRKLESLQNILFSEGINRFNEKEFENALTYFETTIDVANFFNKVDTLAIFNSGMAAEYAKKYDLALKQYKKCIDMGYNSEKSAISIIYIYQLNYPNEAPAIIDTMRKKFPENNDILMSDINMKLLNGEYAEVLPLLEKATENDPYSKILHYTKGTTLMNLNRVEDAIPDFEKAIELDPEYLDANYNLGALYFNLAADKMTAANETSDVSEYDNFIAEMTTAFKNAETYLKKVHEIDANDQSVIQTLMQIYAQLGEDEKYAEMKSKMTN